MLTLENLQSIDWSEILTRAGIIALAVVGAVLLVALLRRVLGIMYLIRQQKVALEITPPAFNDKAIEATDSFFTALHGLESSRTLADKILNHKHVFDARISSSRTSGITFSIITSEEHAGAVKSLLFSYLSNIKIREISYIIKPFDLLMGRVLEFAQEKPYPLPLKQFDMLGSHDPVGYITNAMTKLKGEERITLQVVLTPIHPKNAERIRKKLRQNDNVLASLVEGKNVRIPLMNVISSFFMEILDFISVVQDHGQSTRHTTTTKSRQIERKMQTARGEYPARVISPFEYEDVEPIHQKLSSPLFNTSVRAHIYSPSKSVIKKKRVAIASAMSLYKTKYQSLKLRQRKFLLSKRFLSYSFAKGLLDVFRSPMILSSTELAGLYHFPHSSSAKTENVVKSLSKTLQAPVNLKDGTSLDVLVGQNIHQGTVTPIGLTAEQRQRHMFIVGGTGNGKTTMIKYQLLQDIRSGKGVAVLDPHGDLSEELLRHIPVGRIKDVIYFNPSDVGYPIGLNLLEVPAGLEGDELAMARDFVTESIVSVFRKTFSDDATGGHRIEHNLRNAILTAMTVEDATIFTILDLLTDKEYRKPIVDKLEQDWLKKFWKNEYGKGSAWQQVKAMGGVTAKISRYHASVSADRILSQPTSTINFDDILDGKILICNLAKGLIGEDTSEVLGISILAQLQLAAYRRIRSPESERRPFYVYVDEFQNFATVSFTQMLSESRKYKLFLTMAEQSTQQQEDQQIVQVIMNNIGTLVSFRTGSVADERIIRPTLGERYIDIGELPNLPAYNFYARIVGKEANEPLSGVTVLLNDEGSEEVAERVKASSRPTYPKKYSTPEEKPTPITASKPSKKPQKLPQKQKLPTKSSKKKTTPSKNKRKDRK